MASLLPAVSLLLVARVAGGAAVAECQSVVERVDCSSGVGSGAGAAVALTKAECEARGCCYEESAANDARPSCFFAADGVPIETVHMINSNHFDAGYADLTAAVVNEYFDKYFPRAAAVGEALRAESSNTTGAGPLRWMTFSWLLSLYFDCPSGMGLHCPDANAQASVDAAIRAGDIVWPAFPHNAELATGDASMLSFGVNHTRSLAARFGVPAPTVVSTRDVPGMPRAALPILERAGVRALSEGMNGRMVPVNVPPAFRWRSLDGSVTLPTLWHWHGYGQLGEPGDPITLPGSKHALAYVWRGDNSGPPMSADEVLKNAAALQKQFGNETASSWVRRTGSAYAGGYGRAGEAVRVISSSLDEFVKAVSSETVVGSDGKTPWDLLPEVTADLSDTWIWGVGSDPVKVQRMRALHRARTACERAGQCGPDDAAYLNFSRLTIKNMEHTWGVSVSHFGPQKDKGWSNSDFSRALADKQPNLMKMRSSWVEQRDYGINDALEALPKEHFVRAHAEADFAEVTVAGAPDPAALGYAPVSNTTGVIQGLGKDGWASARFRSDGALAQLATRQRDYVGGDQDNTTFGLLRYQTLTIDDFNAWHDEYLIPGSGGTDEYGKPESFMRAVPTPTHQLAPPSLDQVWRRDANAQSDVLARMTFDSALHKNYGAPVEAWVRYSFGEANAVNLTLYYVNKTATRLPEAAFITFRPALRDGESWEHSVLGEWSSPLDVADGACKGLHFVSEDGVRARGALQIESIDTGLLRWDAPLPFPTPLHRDVNLSQGASFCLHNNIWNVCCDAFARRDG